MPVLTHYKCECCEGKIPIDEWENTGCFSDDWALKDRALCEDCYNCDEDSLIDIICLDKDGIHAFHIGEDHAYGDGDSDPDLEMVDFVRGCSLHWESTDLWRGSFNTASVEGFDLIASGWITGLPDSCHGEKARLNDWLEKIQNEAKQSKFGDSYNFQLYFIISQTSNVCAQGLDIYVKTSEKDLFESWLQTQGFSVKDLNDMLS
jgi:hypothetical protein